MPKVFVLEMTDIDVDAGRVRAQFNVCVVDKDAGSSTSQEMAVYLTGDEGPTEWRDAIVSGVTEQMATYYPGVTVAPADFIIVSMQRGQ